MRNWLDKRVVEGKDVFIPIAILALVVTIAVISPWIVGIWTISGWLFGG